MPIFVVEVYTAGLSAVELDAIAAKARSAAGAETQEGHRVRYVDSIFLPPDELCFHLFEGPSAVVVGTVSARAGLVAERIIEAVRSDVREPTGSKEDVEWGGQDSNPRHEG